MVEIKIAPRDLCGVLLLYINKGTGPAVHVQEQNFVEKWLRAKLFELGRLSCSSMGNQEQQINTKAGIILNPTGN